MKKKILAIAVVFLILAADFFYWNHGLSLGQQLPARVWGKAELYFRYDTEVELSEEDFGFLAAALENTSVTRRPKFQTISDPWFYLVMQRHDGALVILTIVENGDIVMDPGTGKKQYYDNGEELYQVLTQFTKQ